MAAKGGQKNSLLERYSATRPLPIFREALGVPQDLRQPTNHTGEIRLPVLRETSANSSRKAVPSLWARLALKARSSHSPVTLIRPYCFLDGLAGKRSVSKVAPFSTDLTTNCAS